MTTFSPHNNKKSYLLDLFAALSIKCGAKIIPNHGNTTFLGSRFEHFQTLINGGGPNKVRRDENFFRKLIGVPLLFGTL